MKNKILMLFVVLVLMASTVSAASLDLENKDGEPDWNVILNDGISGELVFNDVGQTFDYTLNAVGLQPDTEYSLIYYADDWPGDNPGELLGEITTDSSGEIVGATGSTEMEFDLPSLPDMNFELGAKIWLVLSEDYNAELKQMISWNPDNYLFETEFINYDFDDEDPVILEIQHTPANPTTTDDVTICATVTDNSNVEKVELKWINSGDPENPIQKTMNNIPEGSDIYCRTLSYVSELAEDGLEITYHIRAEDIYGNYDWEPTGFDESFTYDGANPVADANGPYFCDEGTSITLDASESFDTVDEELDYAWDLDYDGEYDDAFVINPEFDCVDDTGGPFTVSVQVTDNVGNTDTGDSVVTVNNLNPTADAGGDEEGYYYCSEGETMTLDASGSSDPAGENDPLTFAWNFGDGSDATGSSPEYICRDGDDKVSVSLTVNDDDEGSDTDTVTIIVVSNEAPVLGELDDISVNEGEEFTVSVSFDDFAGDTHTAEVSWGDDSSDSLETVTSIFVITHTYVDEGDFEVTITVTDDDNNGGDGVGTTSFIASVSNVDPVITDTGEPYVGIVGEEICIDASAHDDGVMDILSWSWTFGDNCHVWEEDGIYSGTLTVDDGDGGSDSEDVSVTVYDYLISLESGWNLISIPLVPKNDDTAIEHILGDLDGVEIVWSYQEGEWSYWTEESDGELTTIIPGFGYYIKMTDDETLYLNGEKMYGYEEWDIPKPPVVTLTPSWNLIGHYGMEDSLSREEVLTTLGDNYATILNKEGNPVSEFNPTEGYWLFQTHTENLDYAPSDCAYGECNGLD